MSEPQPVRATYLSDHVQIYFTLKCNINPSFKLTALKKYITYKWTKESKEKLTNLLCSDTLIKQVVNFEQEEFENNITGIISGIEKITLIFDNISKNVRNN